MKPLAEFSKDQMFGSSLVIKEICKQTKQSSTPFQTTAQNKWLPETNYRTSCKADASKFRQVQIISATAAQHVLVCVVYTCVLPVHVHIEARGWHGCLLRHSPPLLFCLSLKQELPGSTCVCPTVLWLQRLLYLVVTWEPGSSTLPTAPSPQPHNMFFRSMKPRATCLVRYLNT